MSPHQEFNDAESCVEAAICAVGKQLVIAAPLGLGKPNQLLNAFYQRALSDSEVSLHILTALSLAVPKTSNSLEARLLDPFVERVFADYCELDYAQAMRANKLPANIRVSEFYFKAGSMKGVASAQQDYISTNYTYVARDLIERGVNVVVQLVAEDVERSALSLSCNTDVTLDLVAGLQDSGREFFTAAQVHKAMPFMGNRAQRSYNYFDAIVRNDTYNTRLFSTPNMAVQLAEHAIGFHASTLIRDGGTLQIGIGSLGDAIVAACLMRQQHNADYQAIVSELGVRQRALAIGGAKIFKKGLYGCSEMFVNGFLHLMRAGVLSRAVYDNVGIQKLICSNKISALISDTTLAALRDAELINAQLTAEDVDWLIHWGVFTPACKWTEEGIAINDLLLDANLDSTRSYAELRRHCLGDKLNHGIVMHGGFFLGPSDFYQALRDLTDNERASIAMDSVRRINRLDEPVLQGAQRQQARFINTAMMVTLSGAIVSDALENGQVISGVGGQYNFVAQAHELPGARSVIMLRATRLSKGVLKSNIVSQYGHTTVPRHMRDIVVTEYGVADLRACTDSEVIMELLAVSDSRFQQELLEQAKEAGKLADDYEIPAQHCNNTPQALQEKMAGWVDKGYFQSYPLGSDFTDQELALTSTLRELKDTLEHPIELAGAVVKALLHDTDDPRAQEYLQRLNLLHPATPKEVLVQQLLLWQLEEQGYLRAI